MQQLQLQCITCKLRSFPTSCIWLLWRHFLANDSFHLMLFISVMRESITEQLSVMLFVCCSDLLLLHLLYVVDLLIFLYEQFPCLIKLGPMRQYMVL